MTSFKRPNRTVCSEEYTLTPSSVIKGIDPTRTIVTDSVIAIGSQFGPFPGKDAVESKFSNWMQYVTGVQSLDEANLVIFKCGRQLYFHCIRSIQPGMELFVWGNIEKNHLLENLCADFKYAYPCQKCDGIFSSHFGLFAHWPRCRQHFLGKRITLNTCCKCRYCGRIFASRGSLQRHISLHVRAWKQKLHRSVLRKNMKAVSLPWKLRSRKQKEKLRLEDDKEEPTTDPVTCDICGRRFKLHAHLGTHKKFSHKQQRKR